MKTIELTHYTGKRATVMLDKIKYVREEEDGTTAIKFSGDKVDSFKETYDEVVSAIESNA